MRMLAAASAAFALALPWTGPTPHKSADDVLARVADAQGLAFYRPLARERWTPIDRRTTLMPGDSLKTSATGANAISLRLGKGGSELLAGPGVLLRFVDDAKIQLVRGEVELLGGSEAVQVVGPRDTAIPAPEKGERVLLRADEQKIERLRDEPAWLRGYRASATSEWLGSLIAQVDGRDVALTIGSIKISVEIRDQIARTTIEEAFENNTKQTLEGVFRFPLPADASISGFGMWIGDELVEADIVEKQKARRIYEQILRERRDPGLLEWDGGNLFKARVFPIFPRSKKRIRIRYTQVLPLEGRTLRYRYPLRSELLAKFPLDQLVIDAKVWSEDKLVSIASPTHAIQASTDGSTASARYEAENVSPQQDFELRAELGETSPVRLIPHVRDRDGYFMALLHTPGEAGGAWQRTTTPEGAPLDLVLVADVSGSMDEAARATQRAFAESLLSLLGEEDRFRLLTADSEVRAFSAKPRGATPDAIGEALAWLDARESLGWTDVEASLERVHAMTKGEDCVVVYIGDGVDTAGDGDAAALAQRLRARYAKSEVSFHVAHPSASYEAPVVEAIASMGEGSVRRIDAAAPASTASELLREARSPALEDIELRFEGLQTARVYPSTLPRLPRGMQHTVLGRFLPGERARRGRVVVRGTLEGKPVEYEHDVSIPARDAQDPEMSFVPRLWARKHIDALLAEGSKASAQRDAIVAFSEEFGIMTPLTSFLVLESDADRERFGVERRVRMRDGEDFFASARDRATETLLREQLEKVRGWRNKLQVAMYRELAGLGHEMHAAIGAVTRGVRQNWSMSVGGGAGGRFGGRLASNTRMAEGKAGAKRDRGRRSIENLGAPPSESAGEELADELVEEAELEADAFAEAKADKDAMLDEAFEAVDRERAQFAPSGPASPGPARRARLPMAKKSLAYDYRAVSPQQNPSFLQERVLPGRPQPVTSGLAQLGFPALGAAPKPEERIETELSREVRELLEALDRRDAILAAAGALRIRILQQQVHAKRGEVTSEDSSEGLFAQDAWRVLRGSGLRETVESWLVGGERGVLRLGRMLGRKRASNEFDARRIPLQMPGGTLTSWLSSYRRHVARITAREGDVVTLELSLPKPVGRALAVTQMRIDRARRCVLEIRQLQDGELRRRTVFDGFVEALGTSWATSVRTYDDEARLTSRTEIQLEDVALDSAREELRAARALDARAIYAGARDPELGASKNAYAQRKLDVLGALRLLAYRNARQQWDQSAELLEIAAASVSPLQSRDALAWIHADFTRAARRAPELTRRVDELARRADERDGGVRQWHADAVFALARSRFAAAERLALLEKLRSAFRKPSTNGAAIALHWGRRHAQLIRDVQGLVPYGDALRKLIEAHPWSLVTVQDYGRNLSAIHRYEEARAFWRAQHELTSWTRDALATSRSDFLWQARELAELRAMLAQWTEDSPENSQSWHRWLCAEMFADEVAACDAWVERTMRELPAELDDTTRAKLYTCIQHAFGNGWAYSTNRLTPQWSGRLLTLARALLERDETQTLRTITGNWYWRRNNDVQAELRAAVLADLLTEGRIAAMPLDGLEYRLDELQLGKGVLAEPAWKSIYDALRARWESCVAAGDERRNEEARVAWRVLRHCDGQAQKREALDFARARMARSEGPTKRDAAAEVWRRSMSLEDVAAVQSAVVELLPILSAGLEPDAAMARAGNATREATRVVQSLLYKRALGDESARKALDRAALRELQKTARVRARTELSAWLREADVDARFRPWFELEAAGSDSKRGVPTKARRDLLRAAIASGKRIYAAANADPEKSASLLLRERAAILTAYAAVRREADEAMRADVLAWLEALPTDKAENSAKPKPTKKGDAKKGDANKDADDSDDAYRAPDIDGRYHVARFLLASDAIETLEDRLAAWIRPDDVASRWRVLAGYLRAERRDLAGAIGQFERVRALDELQARELGLLADWKLVLGDREGRAEALRAQAFALSTYELRNRISRENGRVSRRGSQAAPEIDPHVFDYIEALLSKESYPSNQIWVVRNLYRTTKDHRILEQLPAGVLGHTQQAVYRYLQSVSRVLAGVHEEASCDRVDAVILAKLEAAKEPLDRRGLWMLRALVRGRAADVRNAPGPHEAVAIEALRESFDAERFSPAEIVLRANFLQTARISGSALQRERVRQLEDLHARCESGSAEHLATGLSLARVLHGSGADRARLVLEAALVARGATNGGSLPSDGRTAWNVFRGWMKRARRFAHAEGLAMRFERAALSQGDKSFMRDQVRTIRIDALEARGTVSIGGGDALYRALLEAIEKELLSASRNQMQKLCRQRSKLALAAKQGKIAKAAEDYIRYANGLLPEIVRTVPRAESYRSVGDTIKKLATPYLALEFAVARLEDQPSYWRRIGMDVWRGIAYSLAVWRAEARVLGTLEKRLVRALRHELEDSLVTMQRSGQSIWTQRNRYFWQERRGDFVDVTLRVIEEHGDSPARIAFATQYLWNGLGAYKQAASARIAAEARGKLREQDRRTLAGWCLDRRVRRADDALRIADALLGEDPLRIDDRLLRIGALRMLDRKPEARAEILATEKLFREQKRLNDHVLQRLAEASADDALHDLATRFWSEAIERREKLLGGVARPDAHLSWLHRRNCESLIALTKWEEAFAAAKSARVAAGQHSSRVREADNVLRRLLASGPLERLIAVQDAEVERSGQDAPVLRKAFGSTWLDKGEPARAAEQLRLAIELQENDPETWGMLLRAYDALGDARAAIATLADAMRRLPFDMGRAKDFAKRLQAAGERAAARRAWTNIVELRPAEADAQRTLARRFESEDAWPAAVTRWRRVVDLRSEEPEGWFGLVTALLSGGQREGAADTLRKMLDRTWEERFGDVKKKAARQLAEIGAR